MQELCQPGLPGALLPRERVCRLLSVNRASFYREEAGLAPTVGARLAAARHRQLIDAIDAIVLEFAGYGYRRVTAQLRRDGWSVNHKLVLQLMRQESLLCRLRRRWVRTTDSEHGLRTYPNLLPHCGWRELTTPDQAWMADITYIRLPQGFAYLAALLDGYSRKVVGWKLGREIDARLVLAALDGALTHRQPPAGWIHHSDRGVQYACQDYVERLRGVGARLSMTAVGSPRENAQAESFFRTLKHEEVYLNDYQTYQQAERSLGRFIEDVYNAKRLHSALGYRPPDEFEALWGGPS
jgi:transposase InsO family protein